MTRAFAGVPFAVLLTGCMNSFYWPAIPNAPMLSKKGELNVAVHGSPIQYQANGAYAATGHLEVRANGDYRLATDQKSTWNADGGLGWYSADAAEEGWRRSVSLDVGTGEVNDLLSQPISFTDENGGVNPTYESTRWRFDFTRVALQGEAGYQHRGYLLGGIVRLTDVDGTLHYNHHDPTGATADGISSEHESFATGEFAVLLRSRLTGAVSAEAQLGMSMPPSGLSPVGASAVESGEYWPYIFAVGLDVDF